MPTRFPGDAQRAWYGRFGEVPGRSRVTRYFHLDETGQAIIDQLHGSHDRLDFAPQPCIARLPGILPTRFDDIPDVVTEAVAAQLKLPAKPSLTAYAVGRPRKRARCHLDEFVLRWNHRHNRRTSFNRLPGIGLPPATYRDLTDADA